MLLEYLYELRYDIVNAARMIDDFATGETFINDLAGWASWAARTQGTSWVNTI